MAILAASNDIPTIADACGAYYDEIAFGPLMGMYEANHAADCLSPCNGPDSVLVIEKQNGRVVGVFFSLIFRSTLYQRKIAVAQEIILHTDPTLSAYKRVKIMKALIELGEKHLKEKGAVLSAIGTRLNAPATGHLLGSMGYVATGTQHHKEL